MSAGYQTTLVHPGCSPIVELDAAGSILSVQRDRKLRLPFHLLGRGFLLSGGTGVGKTTRGLDPLVQSAIKSDATVILLDCQGGQEAAKAIMATRRYRGETPIIFAPLHKSLTARLNLLEAVDPNRFEQSLRASRSLTVGESRGSGDRFFDQQRDACVAAVIRALLKRSPGANLGDVAEVFAGGYAAVGKLSRETGCPELGRLAEEIRTENRNTQTTFSCVVNALLPFRDPTVAASVARSTFSWKQLEERPSVFIYLLEEHEVERLLPLTNMMIDQLLTFVMGKSASATGQLKRPFYLFIDELASAVGKIEGLHRRILTLRKRGLSFIGACQNLGQIVSVFGERDGESLIQGFSSKVFIPPLSLDDARRVSELSGQVVVDQLVTKPDGHTIDRVEPRVRPLLSIDDVQNPVPHSELGPKMTFLLAGRPPFQGYLRAAWEDPEMRESMSSARWQDLLRSP